MARHAHRPPRATPPTRPRPPARPQAALKHVPRLGWTEAALQAAAGEQGLSPAVVGILPRGAGSLAEFYVARCNQQLKADLAAMTPQLASMRVTQRVHTAVRKRLEMLAPHIDSWPQALALLAAPASAPHAAALLFELVDDIWYASGDTSHDYSWYSKRALLAGVYVSTGRRPRAALLPAAAAVWMRQEWRRSPALTPPARARARAELYMLTDFSPGYADTWEALERRLADVLTLGRLTASMGTGEWVGGCGRRGEGLGPLPQQPAEGWVVLARARLSLRERQAGSCQRSKVNSGSMSSSACPPARLPA
jgi:ubiquinone biosynthesis protein COQ9